MAGGCRQSLLEPEQEQQLARRSQELADGRRTLLHSRLLVPREVGVTDSRMRTPVSNILATTISWRVSNRTSAREFAFAIDWRKRK
jgi:hypothetical protein